MIQRRQNAFLVALLCAMSSTAAPGPIFAHINRAHAKRHHDGHEEVSKPLTYSLLGPRSRETRSLCKDNNLRFINAVCTYPGQRWPCLHDTTYLNGTIYHAYKLERLAEHMCEGLLEAQQILDDYCCYGKECLLFCYGLPKRRFRMS